MRKALGVVLIIVVIALVPWFAAPRTEDAAPSGVRPSSVVEPPVGVEPPSAVEPVETSLGIPEDAEPATVNYVHDGDTIFLDTPKDSNLKVRLLAVDTPEVGDNLECYGNEARDFTRSLLPEGSTVYTLADVEPYDQYGRALLFVWTADGELVNYSLVAEGYAEAVFIGRNRMLEDDVEAAEDSAEAGPLGIWANC